MTAFVKYNSIENHYREKSVHAWSLVVPEDEDFIFTEKVHGANLQVYVNKDGIRIARRGDFLAPGENFNGAQQVIGSQEEKFTRLFGIMQGMYDVHEISVCGEIFGGDYPGIKSNCAMVQKGVYYSPERHFYAFDLRIFENGKTYTETDPAPYVNWSVFAAAMDQVELFRAKELGRLKCWEVCRQLREHNAIASLPPQFRSTIPERLGHPDPPMENFAEGYVIRPFACRFDKHGNRIIFKYKNPKFSEIAKAPAPPKPTDDALEAEWDVVETKFMTRKVLKNRLDNVLSKESWELTDNKKRGLIIKALTEDVMEDVEKHHEEFALQKLKKRVGGACSKFIQSVVAGAH